MDWSALAIVLATALGPVLAVWASEYRQEKRAVSERRKWVFHTLWATRTSRLSQDHVAALNQIDLAFPAKDFPKISEAWGLYLAHLNIQAAATEAGQTLWFQTASNLLSDLVHLMASDIGYPLPKTLVNSAYYPGAHVSLEQDQAELKKMLLELLRGERALPVKTKE